MSELFRLDDADGRSLVFVPVGDGDLLAWTGRDGAVLGDRAIVVPADQGRRLLAALQAHYSDPARTESETREWRIRQGFLNPDGTEPPWPTAFSDEQVAAAGKYFQRNRLAGPADPNTEETP